jgi:uncharacterized delta-60 repeat protein
MWLSCARKARRTQTTHLERAIFRPQLEALEDRCLLNAGALDPTFGTGDLVSGGPSVQVLAVAVYPSGSPYAGKTVVGGSITSATQPPQWALERFNTDGTPDRTFGNNGIVASKSIKSGSVAYDTWYVNGLAIQSDGKIVAVGAVQAPSGIGVARYNPNGTLDTSFTGGNRTGTGLVVIYVVPSGLLLGFNYGIAVGIQANDNKIVVAGYCFAGTFSPYKPNSASYFALLRYNTNGTLDNGFGQGGIVTQNFGNSDEARALAIQPDGKIVVAGGTYTNTHGVLDDTPVAMAVARYTPSGKLDLTFGTGGIVTGLKPASSSGASASGVVLQNDGKIIICGSAIVGSSKLMTVARLNTNGQADPAFGASGFAISGGLGAAPDANRLVIGNAIGLSSNGDVLATGSTLSMSTADFGVEAFLPSGVPDPTFGNGGIATADFGGGADYPHAVAIQSDGKVVLAGVSTPSSASTGIAALARFQPPDTKIGSFTASSYTVTAGALVTFSVSNILEGNPSSTIAGIVFYLDSISGAPLPVSLISNSNGAWSYSFDTTGLATGTHTIYAVAVDSLGVFSDPALVVVTVQ